MRYRAGHFVSLHLYSARKGPAQLASHLFNIPLFTLQYIWDKQRSDIIYYSFLFSSEIKNQHNPTRLEKGLYNNYFSVGHVAEVKASGYSLSSPWVSSWQYIEQEAHVMRRFPCLEKTKRRRKAKLASAMQQTAQWQHFPETEANAKEFASGVVCRLSINSAICSIFYSLLHTVSPHTLGLRHLTQFTWRFVAQQSARFTFWNKL